METCWRTASAFGGWGPNDTTGVVRILSISSVLLSQLGLWDCFPSPKEKPATVEWCHLLFVSDTNCGCHEISTEFHQDSLIFPHCSGLFNMGRWPFNDVNNHNCKDDLDVCPICLMNKAHAFRLFSPFHFQQSHP